MCACMYNHNNVLNENKRILKLAKKPLKLQNITWHPMGSYR